jgi:hypothetical protein
VAGGGGVWDYSVVSAITEFTSGYLTLPSTLCVLRLLSPVCRDAFAMDNALPAHHIACKSTSQNRGSTRRLMESTSCSLKISR